MRFIIINQEIFQTNLSVNNVDTRNKHHLQRPKVNLSCFKKSTFYAGIKIFNSYSVTAVKHEKAKFQETLRKYLNTHFLYAVDDF
jgi:hypothetical protein